MAPSLSTSITSARANLLSSSLSLSSAANEFVALVEQIEHRYKELEEREGKCKVKEDEMERKEKELEGKKKNALEDVKRLTMEVEAKMKGMSEHEVKLRGLERRMEEKEREWEKRQEQMRKNADRVPSLIKLHIGYASLICPKDILLSYKGSYFEKMLTSDHQQFNGEYYIDYCSDNFPVILEYMISKAMTKILTMGREKRKELRADFEYFGLPFLRSELVPDILAIAFNQWLPNNFCTLLYKGSRDGFAAQDFHKACDNKGPTMAIIQSEEGYLFGGYAPIPWTSSNSSKIHPDFFLFTLSNPHNIPPTQYKLKPTAHQACYDHQSCHVIFGGGDDIQVNVSTPKNQYTIFGHSYIDTTGKGDKTLTGARLFKLKDVEVYQLV